MWHGEQIPISIILQEEDTRRRGTTGPENSGSRGHPPSGSNRKPGPIHLFFSPPSCFLGSSFLFDSAQCRARLRAAKRPPIPTNELRQRAAEPVILDAKVGNYAIVAKIMKTSLPDNAKIAREAKECMQECVSEYISFITSEGQSVRSRLRDTPTYASLYTTCLSLYYHVEKSLTVTALTTASDKCSAEKRKTVNGEDIIFAMQSLGFENYAEAAKVYLTKYREVSLRSPPSCSPFFPPIVSLGLLPSTLIPDASPIFYLEHKLTLFDPYLVPAAEIRNPSCRPLLHQPPIHIPPQHRQSSPDSDPNHSHDDIRRRRKPRSRPRLLLRRTYPPARQRNLWISAVAGLGHAGAGKCWWKFRSERRGRDGGVVDYAYLTSPGVGSTGQGGGGGSGMGGY